MNQPWGMVRAKDLAGRVAKIAGDDAVEAVRAMYRIVFARDPAPDEIEVAATYVSPNGPLRLQRLAARLVADRRIDARGVAVVVVT